GWIVAGCNGIGRATDDLRSAGCAWGAAQLGAGLPLCVTARVIRPAAVRLLRSVPGPYLVGLPAFVRSGGIFSLPRRRRPHRHPPWTLASPSQLPGVSPVSDSRSHTERKECARVAPPHRARDRKPEPGDSRIRS